MLSSAQFAIDRPLRLASSQTATLPVEMTFPKIGYREFRGHFGGSPAKRAYIETRILTGVAGTIAHDLRFPGRVHDAGDVNDNGGARAILEDNAGWADDDRDGYFRNFVQMRGIYFKQIGHGSKPLRSRSL
jgi:hypothetical protein